MNVGSHTEKAAAPDLAATNTLLASLRQEIAQLTERVAALETANRCGAPRPRVEMEPTPIAPRDVRLDEEVVAVIAAAIAAYLGKKPRIRQIRLIGTNTWGQQGRVTIQTSHVLAAGHTRSER